MWCRDLYSSHFTVENVEAQRGYAVCPQSRRSSQTQVSGLQFTAPAPSTCRQTLNFLMEGFRARESPLNLAPFLGLVMEGQGLMEGPRGDDQAQHEFDHGWLFGRN